MQFLLSAPDTNVYIKITKNLLCGGNHPEQRKCKQVNKKSVTIFCASKVHIVLSISKQCRLIKERHSLVIQINCQKSHRSHFSTSFSSLHNAILFCPQLIIY